MAMFSSSALSLHPKPHIKSSISSKHAVLVTSSCRLSTIFGLHPKRPFQRITACIPATNAQNSNPSTLTSDFLSAHKKISKVLVENGVKLLVGSLFLVGSLSAWPVVAVPVQNGVTIEEEGDTQHEKAEDEELFMKLLEKEPRNVDALKVVVNGLMRKGRTKEAVKYVEKLIDIEPDQVEWRLLQALCYEMMGQLSKAKRLFKEILKRRPLLLRALHGLAMVMHKNHEGDAVFDMLNKALELACREQRVTEERNIKILTAQMHLVQGDLDEALKKYQELIDENPRDFRPYLCQLLRDLSGAKEALECSLLIFQQKGRRCRVQYINTLLIYRRDLTLQSRKGGSIVLANIAKNLAPRNSMWNCCILGDESFKEFHSPRI